MRVFLTGASGILGTDINNVLSGLNHNVIGFDSKNINIGDFNDVSTKVKKAEPDIIIHCAAMTNVDLCEEDKKAAVLANVIGPQNMAVAARMVGAKIVYISSCGVYGNSNIKTPYTELDDTNPITYHHYTKLIGENAVKESHNNFLIIRPGWLFGGTILHKKNFVEARRKEAVESPILKSAIDKIGSPTYTYDVANQLATLLYNDFCGTYNIVNEGCASRFQYVSEIVKLFNLPSIVEPASSSSFQRKANMPDNECLDNLFLNLHNVNEMRNWKDALKDYIFNNY